MKLTQIAILVFILGLTAFDLWTINARGYESTVSWTLYSMSHDWPAIPFFFGFIMGHLFFSQDHKT